jgi:magnesium chelatase family protein
VASFLDGPVSRVGQTETMREIVRQARDRARARAKRTGVLLNKDIPPNRIFECLGLPSDRAELLVTRIISNNVSTRSLLRCLRVARTVADIGGRDIIDEEDLKVAWSWQSYSAAKKRGEIIPI